MSDRHLLNLLQLADLTLPVGGYAHSAGLETYVQQGIVSGLPSAEEFVTGMLTRSLQYTDAAFVSLAYDAADQHDNKKIVHLDQECHAVKLPAEIRQASAKLGIRLMKIFDTLCPGPVTRQYRNDITLQKANGHYCIAFGLYASALQIPKEDALTGFYYNAAAGMITNCVKLIPLGQQQGQQMLFSLQPLITQLVQSTMIPDEAMIGFSCAGFDIHCMQHEQLYSRLYMS